MIDRQAARAMRRMFAFQPAPDSADNTDWAISALRSGVTARTVERDFGDAAADRARLTVKLFPAHVNCGPSDRFIGALQADLLDAFEGANQTRHRTGVAPERSQPGLTASARRMPTRSTRQVAARQVAARQVAARQVAARQVAARQVAARQVAARQWAASLAVAATVMLALFARIGPSSLGGVDTSATAIAATGTVTIGTPVASGTAVPVVALLRVDH